MSIDVTTLFDAVLEGRVRVERRRSDGVVWLRLEDMHGEFSAVTAMDADMAWALARALVQEPERLNEEGGS